LAPSFLKARIAIEIYDIFRLLKQAAMIITAIAMASMQFIVIDFSQWQSYEKQLTFIKTPHSILIFYKLIPPVETGGNE